MRQRLSLTRAAQPEWTPWLNLLELVFDALDDDAWRAVAPALTGAPTDGAPLLDRARVPVDPALAERWVLALVAAAASGTGPEHASLGRPPARRLDALALIEAAIRYDADAIGALADDAGVGSAALATVAQLAAVPLLHACREQLAGRVPRHWRRGYCPICGAWPILAEVRGLDRSRRLRCGRCAADWEISVLRCPYCDETHHERLGSLLPEGCDQHRRIDVCRSCSGYIKTVTTLKATPDPMLALEDVDTIHLDFVAQEHGYERPERAPRAARVELVRAEVTGTGPPREALP